MTNAVDTPAAASTGPGGATAGARLRTAREAAGLSVDAVAQQLKLAPRQVKALEEDDFQHLPGRTFVRGFTRNYARFVHLDPDAVLALLPAPDAAPALAGAGRPMGELPVEGIAKPSATHWVAPLLLLAVIAAVGYYELAQPQWQSLRQLFAPEAPATTQAPRAATQAPATAEAPRAMQAPAPPARAGVTTALPNPVAGSAAPATDAASAAKDGAAVPAGVAGAPAPSAGAAASAAPSASAAAEVAATTPAEVSLVLSFRGTSWAEVKDAKGRVVLQMTGGAGMTQTVSALPPLELALGNAPQVDVTFRGQALDLAPYTRGNVARVALK